MAERLNDEQLQSLSAQMQKRAERYEMSAREYLQHDGRANELLAEHENAFAQRLRDVLQGIGIALGEVEPVVKLGPATTESFDPNLPVGQVSERAFWTTFHSRVESKQHLSLPTRPADAQGGHEIRP